MDNNSKPKEETGSNDISRKRRNCRETSDDVEPKKEAIEKREPPTFLFVDRQETIPDPDLQVLFYFFMTYSDLVLLNLMRLLFPEDDKNPKSNRTYCGTCGSALGFSPIISNCDHLQFRKIMAFIIQLNKINQNTNKMVKCSVCKTGKTDAWYKNNKLALNDLCK
ncbi:hypothetical protein CRE_07222 [Caenorhabditis remanei]|uniref:Uncharacterized protein n=1 Tax=Caenorhabditis remanei TaxID=31234 RepID=E3M2Y4_CAERE|nr:hypothetical protein CRE_07222 [Caenorhabditis remanei]